jgi:hypothetical protein
MGRRPRDDVDTEVGGDPLEDTTVIADCGVYFSSDGLRRHDEFLNVSHKKCCVQLAALNDSYGEWIPVPEEGYNDDENRDSADHPINAVDSQPGTKRKVYASSVSHGIIF